MQQDPIYFHENKVGFTIEYVPSTDVSYTMEMYITTVNS